MTNDTASSCASAPAHPPRDVDAVRAEFAACVRSYRDLVAAASKASGASLVRVDGAFAAFEPGYFNNLLVALAARFPARVAAAAGGDAVGELRLVVAAIVDHGGVMTAHPAVRHEADASVLRLDPGDRVALNADDFEELAAAFLDAIAASTSA